MILLKADSQLEPIFRRLIHTLGVKVEWNSIFLIEGSQLVLPGRVRSLYFDYDSKRVYTNIEEFTMNTWNAEEIEGNDVLMNVINMTLYVFGKWGSINLKVDKDYDLLNRLFQKILKEVRVEPDYRVQGFKFYQNNIQITYEDVIQKAIDWGKPEDEKENIEDGEEPEETALSNAEPEEESEGMGLWHKLVWKREQVKIVKSPRTKEDEKRARLGRNFYMVDYNCPLCSNKLYMAVYPVNKEYVIETNEGRLYMARVYTCSEGCSFYTPAPDKLLAEGDIYSYHFEEDRKAYEDYTELIGASAGRYSNYKFNELESQRQENKEKEAAEESLEELCEIRDDLPESKLAEVLEKIDGGFYPSGDVKKYESLVAAAIKKSQEGSKGKRTDLLNERIFKNSPEKAENAAGKMSYVPVKADTAASKNSRFDKKKEIVTNTAAEERPEDKKTAFDNQNQKDRQSKAASAAFLGKASSASGNMSRREQERGVEGKSDGAAEETVTGKTISGNKNKSKGNSKILGAREDIPASINTDSSNVTYKIKKEESFIRQPGESRTDWMRRGAEACRKKTYEEIGQLINTFKEEGKMDEEQASILFRLEEMKRRKGLMELASLFERMPEPMDVKHYDLYKDTLKKYKDMDISSWEKDLESRRDRAECEEIGEFVKNAPKNSRAELSKLYDDLKRLDYKDKNKDPYLKKIFDKLYEMDQTAIQKICPDIMDLSFGEALKVYDEIEKGIYLPELKTNTLEMLQKRLTRMKTEENSQLIRKFMRDLDDKIKNSERLHFYDAGNMLRKRVEKKEADLLNRAVETYASQLRPYEYPLLIGDSTRKGTGKEGFILTPDHIFYATKLMEGMLEITDVEEVKAAKGKLGNNITVLLNDGKSKKIPAVVPKEEREALAEVLEEFILYLQEKPESRSIDYLAKERHEVKCCLRCGFQYRDGNICPKCGSKANK